MSTKICFFRKKRIRARPGKGRARVRSWCSVFKASEKRPTAAHRPGKRRPCGAGLPHTGKVFYRLARQNKPCHPPEHKADRGRGRAARPCPFLRRAGRAGAAGLGAVHHLQARHTAFFSSRRSTRAKGSVCVAKISVTVNAVGSSLLPQPMALAMGAPASVGAHGKFQLGRHGVRTASGAP